MTISRRALCGSLATLTAAAVVAPARTSASPDSKIALPDKANFPLDHVYLNAAYTHPFGRFAFAAGETFFRARMTDPDRPWPDHNARDSAVEAFARLINAAPEDIAVVPSIDPPGAPGVDYTLGSTTAARFAASGSAVRVQRDGGY
jgi:hypothetical protein